MEAGTVFKSHLCLTTRHSLDLLSIKKEHSTETIFIIIQWVVDPDGGAWYAVLSSDHGLVYFYADWFTNFRDAYTCL